MNEKKLLIFLFELLESMNNESKNMYEFLSQFLSEKSHSFGFKPLDNLESKIINKLDFIYKYEISYYKYEKFYSWNDFIINIEHFLNLNQNQSFKIFNLIIEIFEDLEKESFSNGKLFSTLTEEEDVSPSMLFDFQPIYKLRDKFIIKFDRIMIGNINGSEHKEYCDDYGIIYNFLLRGTFLHKNKFIILDNIKIHTNKDLFYFLINY